MRKAFLLAVLGLSAVRSAAQPCDEKVFLASLATATADSPAWAEARQRLARRMANPRETLQRLFAAAPETLRVIRRIDYGAHGGAYEAETPQGPAVIKVFHQETAEAFPSKYFTELAIQEFLGDIGIAARVLGIYPKERAQGLGLKGGAAIVMEKIGDGSVTVKRHSVPQTWAFSPSTRERLSFFSLALSRLRIRPDDADAIFNENGTPFLIDFDAYTFFTDEGYYFYRSDVALPIDRKRVVYRPESENSLYLKPWSWTEFMKREARYSNILGSPFPP